MATVNPFRFSTKYQDDETGLLYYGYRFYDPLTGRWLSQDPVTELGFQAVTLLVGDPVSRSIVQEVVSTAVQGRWSGQYVFVRNTPVSLFDLIGLFGDGYQGGAGTNQFRGHSDFYGHTCFDYTLEDHDPNTEPLGHPAGHFQDFGMSLQQVMSAVRWCDRNAFERAMHRLQDFWTHYKKGYRWDPPRHLGHALALTNPDNDDAAWAQANEVTRRLVRRWNDACHCTPCFE